MRVVKIICFLALISLVSGCACRTRHVGPSDNIPMAQEGVILKDVHFAFDKFALSEAGKSILQENAAWLNENAETTIEIEGHCDERGTNEYNMVLGANRAKAVFDYLQSLGVDMSELSTVSYGEEVPLDPGHTEDAWAKNRRVHFNIK